MIFIHPSTLFSITSSQRTKQVFTVVYCNLKRVSKPSTQCVILVILYIKKDADDLETYSVVKYYVN